MPPKPGTYADEWAKRLNFALLLKQLRDGVRTFTQSDIAAAVAKILRKKKPHTTQAVSRWLLGQSVPDSEVQIALAQWLDVDPGWLVAGHFSAAPAPQTPAKLMSIDITDASRRRRQSNDASRSTKPTSRPRTFRHD